MSLAGRMMGLLAAGSLLVAVPAAAQLPSETVERVRTRAREAGLSRTHEDEALALMDEAAREGLPVEPLEAKYLEGLAKDVPAARVMAALRTVRSRLLRARVLLEEARGDGVAGEPGGPQVSRVAAALTAGVPPGEVALLGEAAGRVGAPVDRLVAAVATLEQLRAMGVYRPEAAAGLADALRAGYDEDDLSRVAEDYRRHAAVGGEPEAFFRQLGSGPPGGAGVAGTGLGEGTSGSVGEGRLPNERGGAAEGLVPGVEGMGERDEDSPYRGGPRDPADAFRPDGPHEPGPPDTPRP